MGFESDNDGMNWPMTRLQSASVKAREAHRILRDFIEQDDERALNKITRDELNAALNTIGDRLQTCDALEFKLSKLETK